MSFVSYCRSQSQSSLLSLALVGVLLVGLFDYVTGYEISLFLFYAGPILFAVWFLDRKSTISDRARQRHRLVVGGLEGGPSLFCRLGANLGDRRAALFFTFVAIGGTAIKSRRDSMEEWLADMRRLRELERDIVARQRAGAAAHRRRSA